MKITIGDKEFSLNPEEVKFSRNLVDKFIEGNKTIIESRGVSQYLTTILYLYVKSSKLIHSLGLDNYNTLMEYFNEESSENDAD